MPTKTELIQMIGSIIDAFDMPEDMREEIMKKIKSTKTFKSEIELQVSFIKTMIMFLTERALND
tara:strand:+ start:3090 stop:3281 length:192 start_codon:yes stop_codon:yes gene_type:complete